MIFSKNRGFTIVELMIAIAIGMLIIAALSQVYLGNRKNFLVEEGLARLQENGRYATYMLNKDIRMIGFVGCSNQGKIKINNLIKNPTYSFDLGNSLRGYDSATSSFSPVLPTNLSTKALPGSDVLELRMATFFNVNLNDDMHKSNNPIPVSSRTTINAGDPLLITDCRVGDLFVAGSNSNAAVITHTVSNNTQNELSTAYLQNAKVMKYAYYAYYVKNTGRTNDKGQPIYALVRQDANGVENEIADGVEKMRITYLVDTNNDKNVDTYQTATQVDNSNNWDNVRGVQISLLLSTTEDVNDKNQSYAFNGVTSTPTDKKLRREWDSFINIRNRGL